MTTKHLPRLDSLRGIAALMVGGFHAGLSAAPATVWHYLALMLGFFFDGRTAVSIFFVLSGLVLGMSLRRLGAVTPAAFFHFCGRRFFRLYPAYAVSTLFYLMLYFAIRNKFHQGQPIGHGWCDYYSTDRFSSGDLIGNFLFLSQHLNVATWTLKVEAQAALLLPFLHAFSVRFRTRGQALLFVVLAGLCLFSGSGSTRINLPLFYMGYLIPPLLEMWRSTRFAETYAKGGVLFALAITLLAVPHLFGSMGFGSRFAVLIAGVGSALLLIVILIASSHPVFNLLDHKFVKYLGLISYSYYLFNLLSVDLVQRLIFSPVGIQQAHPFLGWWLIFIVSSLLCAALASVSFHLVERPAVKLGGYLLPTAPGKVHPRVLPASG